MKKDDKILSMVSSIKSTQEKEEEKETMLSLEEMLEIVEKSGHSLNEAVLLGLDEKGHFHLYSNLQSPALTNILLDVAKLNILTQRGE